jgi:hypothetical protein
VQSASDEEAGRTHEPEPKRIPFWSSQPDTYSLSSSSHHMHVVSSELEGCASEYDHSDLQVPSRFQRGCGNPAEALRRWRLTLEWRREHHVNDILSEPQPHFGIIKQCYPHFIHGRSRQGHPVYYEQLGHIDIERLKSNGVSINALLRHYIFITEYMWNVVEPDDNFGQTVTILDVEGVGMSDLIGDALDFLTESSKVISSHYVERCRKIYVVNASYMFSFLWKMVMPLIHENTRQKVSILSASEMNLLQEMIDPSELPVKYGGTGGPLGSSADEIALLGHVKSLSRGEGVPLTVPVVHSNRPKMEYATSSATTATTYTAASRQGGHVDMKLSSISGKKPCKVIDNKSSGTHECEGGVDKAVHQNRSVTSTTWRDSGVEMGGSSSDEDDTHATLNPSTTSSNPISWLGYGQSMLYSTLSVASSAFIPISEHDSHQAHLGKSNSFVYNSETQKWELVGGLVGKDRRGCPSSLGASPSMVSSIPEGSSTNSQCKRTSSLSSGGWMNDNGESESESGDEMCDDEDSNEEEVIRAIQAAHGYVSESDAEDGPERELSGGGGDIRGIGGLGRDGVASKSPASCDESTNSSGATNGYGIIGSSSERKAFRMNIRQRKIASLQAISMWSVLHWCWRASLMCSVESLPVFVLLSASHKGLNYSPVLMGTITFIAAITIGIAQWVHFAYHPLSTPGFFRSSLTLVLTLEVFSLTVVIALASICTTTSLTNPRHHTLTNDIAAAVFVLFLGIAFGSLLFSLGVSNLFTSTVMVSHKSHFYSPLARSSAHLADALGAFLGIVFVLAWDASGLSSALALLTPFIVTCITHVIIAVMNAMYPRAAGHGVELGNIVW